MRAPRARKVHEILEGLLAAEGEFIRKNATCSKGCSHCCYLHVCVTEDEANLLERLVRRNDMQIDKDRLLAQLEVTKEDYTKSPMSIRKCIFLGDDNACRIYEDRPSTCRTYFSADTADKCELKPEDAPRNIKKLFLLNAELFVTASMNLTPSATQSIAYWFKKKGLI
jgi:Fe-S-cluster containining protein